MDFFDLFAETKGVPKRESRMETPFPETSVPRPPICPERPPMCPERPPICSEDSGCDGLPEDSCGMMLAMAYIPMQKWNQTYEPPTGFEQGTIFPELNLPFLGKKGVQR